MRSLRNIMGIRGAGQDAEQRRARQEKAAEGVARLKQLLPSDPFGPFLSPEQIALAASDDADGRGAELVRDVIRRRHLAALVTLAEWQPGMDTDALVEAAGRVKELLELEATLSEIAEKAGKAVLR